MKNLTTLLKKTLLVSLTMFTLTFAYAQVNVDWTTIGADLRVLSSPPNALINNQGYSAQGDAVSSNMLPACRDGSCQAIFTESVLGGYPVSPLKREWVYGLDANASPTLGVTYAFVMQRDYSGTHNYTVYAVKNFAPGSTSFSYLNSTTPSATIPTGTYKIEKVGTTINFYINSALFATLPNEPKTDLTVVSYLIAPWAIVQDAKATFSGTCANSTDDWKGAASGTMSPFVETDNIYIPAKLGLGSAAASPATRLDVDGVVQIRNAGYIRIGAYDPVNDRYAYVSSGGQIENVGLKFETTNGWGTGGETRMTITDAGDVGIGNTTPNEKLHVSGNMQANTTVYPSDSRFKKDIVKMTDALSKINQLSGYTYSFKKAEFPERNFDSRTHYGFIAQELKEVLPETVVQQPDGYYAVEYTALIPVLAEAIKQQQAMIEDNKKEIEDLKLKVQASTGIPSVNPSKNSGAILYQNTPNPYSGSTTIKYFLPESISQASLLVFDMSGKQVKAYSIITKGNGEITINGSEFSQGMYLYSLVADGLEIDTKRMILSSNR